MTGSARVRAAQAAIRAAAGAGADLCAPCLAVLPVSGAAVSVLSSTVSCATVCASDPIAARIDELQFDLGEGPCWQALDAGRPVLVPDVHTRSGHPDWPMFGAAVHDSGAGAVFSFPLVVGTVDLGALDLYRVVPGRLEDAAVADALALAATLAMSVLRRLTDATAHARWDPVAGSRREVHQATGMILAQLDVPAGEAYARLRGHAFTTGRPVLQVAGDVINRRLRFDQLA